MNSVVHFVRQGEVGFVQMEDREYRNTLSRQLIRELRDTIRQASSDPSLKVLVVHGYDNYFCCGGTKEELIGLSDSVTTGTGAFTLDDLNFYDLFLQCEIPVIAAMGGHAIGAGLSLGCFADLLVMGEECVYNAIFMKYGFTPGMGATYIIPKKFGEALGHEMLFSAQNYYGRELKERGAPVKIVNKQDVLQTAADLAFELAEKPRFSLQVLKQHLNRDILRDLPDVIAREKRMHEMTFARPEVRTRIESLFGK